MKTLHNATNQTRNLEEGKKMDSRITNINKSAFVLALSLGVASIGSAHAAGNTLVNPSFETGDLTGWTASSSSPYATNAYQAYIAPWEDNFAVVPAGCYTTSLYQTFDATEGNTVLGWSFFKANDYLPYNDTGVVKVIIEGSGSAIEVFTSSVAEVGSYGGTPWTPWLFTAPEDGTYTIKVESTNTLDCGFTSAVGIDLATTGGMVTGGGWISSPAGAYTADTLLEGKASFGFVSKYKKGQNAPTGNTQFQFQTGDLNFHSDSYDWLIVNQAGTNAQFKGDGTVNNSGNYGFMLWAGDSSPDTFRIKIWDKDNGDATVYDNGVQQSLGGGSIVVHKK